MGLLGLRVLPALALLLALFPFRGEAQEPDPSPLETPAEARAFQRHTAHDEMMAWIHRLADRTPELAVERYGTTWEGRDLPLLVFSRGGGMTPEAAREARIPVVVLGANVHGFNHVVREALLLLARELGTPGTPMNALLDRVVVVMAPSKNPDGLELESRFNARGADLNRDYMTLDEVELAAYLRQVIQRWDPHLVLDGHDGGDVQYGGARPYHLLHQGPGLAGADPRLGAFMAERLVPELDQALRDAGYRAFSWARGDTLRWHVGGSSPRMGRNYGGLADRLTLLFEVPAWTGLAGGVEVSLHALRALLAFVGEEGPALVATVEGARAETIRLGERGEGEIPVRERMDPAPERITFERPHPEREGELLTVSDAEILNVPVGTAFRPRPVAYLLPPGADPVVDLLLRHGIEVAYLEEDVTLQLSGYRATEVRWTGGANHARSALEVRVGETFLEERVLPRGSVVVRTGQPLGRVVAHLLEPESQDGVFHWGRMTAFLAPELLAGGGGGDLSAEAPERELPVWKLMEPVELPTIPHPRGR